MNAPDFLDTNILIYAYDPRNREKQEIARGLVRAAPRDGVVSSQVLGEFASVLLHKRSPVVSPDEVRRTLRDLAGIPTIATDSHMVHRAIDVKQRYGIHFYDGMIVAAAERAKCARIWSEDLAAGQDYFGVRVENPFA